MTYRFISIYISFSFSFLTASAQDFEVAPAKLNFDCESGQIQTKGVTVYNHSNRKQQFSVTLADLQADSAGKKKNINKNTTSTGTANVERSCKDWITMNPSFFDLNPNESKEIKVVMQVPPGQSQTRWAMIHVTPTEEQTSMAADINMKTGVRVKPRIGIRVIQSPKSNTNYKGIISDFKETTQPKDTIRTFQVKVTNTGDKLIDGKIHLVLSNLITAQEIKAKPTKVSVLPGNARMATLILPAKTTPGKYSLAAILDYGNNTALEAIQMTIEVK